MENINLFILFRINLFLKKINTFKLKKMENINLFIVSHKLLFLQIINRKNIFII